MGKKIQFQARNFVYLSLCMLTKNKLNPYHAEYFMYYTPQFCQPEHPSCKHVFSIRVENSVDLDQMALSEAI